jgi:hypothetical protein
VIARVFYRLGYLAESAAEYYFARRSAIYCEAMKRASRYLGALQQFENYCESAVPFLPHVNAIWSCHDISGSVVAGSVRIDQELASRRPSAPERRELRFVENFERLVAKKSRLILSITPEDRDVIRSQWGQRMQSTCQ